MNIEFRTDINPEQLRSLEEQRIDSEYKMFSLIPGEGEPWYRQCVGSFDTESGTPDQAVGFVAVRYVFTCQTFEVGALVVDDKYKKQGLSDRLIKELEQGFKRPCRAVAFANEQSVRVFLNNGYAHATTDTVPAEGLSYCAATCNRYEQEVRRNGRVCCDEIVEKTYV